MADVVDRPLFKQHIKGRTTDSARWERIAPRAGDVIVATPAKCGTTWVQMLCALLIHGAPPFAQPLSLLSPWVDRTDEPVERVSARMKAQKFQRIFKTHTPLTALHYREDAFYVICGRDPRDAGLSSFEQSDNAVAPMAAQTSFNTAFRQAMLTLDRSRASLFDHIASFWPYRQLPNFLFLHYEDLSDDLETEMRRLAAFLGIERTPEEQRALLVHASFAAMRADADATAPDVHTSNWKSNEAFYAKGRRGEWRKAMSAENQALYLRATRARFDPTMMDWMERGRAAVGDPRIL